MKKIEAIMYMCITLYKMILEYEEKEICKDTPKTTTVRLKLLTKELVWLRLLFVCSCHLLNDIFSAGQPQFCNQKKIGFQQLLFWHPHHIKTTFVLADIMQHWPCGYLHCLVSNGR
ncbi:hypothetical protein LXL04_004837 [Taraxacum kok-saghyz]